MARGSTKPRDLDFSQVGTMGRRTGLTLKEGRRDEYGMEEVDGLFSSPEKSPAKLNGFNHSNDDDDDDDDSASSDMSIDEGNAPGPLDYLGSANRSRGNFLPAQSRSPAKAASRRSPVLRSTPDEGDDLLSPSPSDGKGWPATRESRQDPSPLTARSVNAGSNKKNGSGQKQKVPEPITVSEFSDGEYDENADSFGPAQDDFSDSLDAGNETVMPDDDNETADATVQDLNTGDNYDSPEPENSQPAGKLPSKTKQTQKKGTAAKSPQASQPAAKPAKPRGRPPKTQRPADEEPSDTRQPKKQKTSNSKSSRPPREPLEPELEQMVENYAQRTGPLKGRSLYILKREDPSGAEATHTRSGRVSVRPLAYWRNERCVFGDGEAAEGQRYPLSTIKEVIRTEELEPEKQKKGKRSRNSKSKKRKDESSDEEDEEVDLWEKEGGVLHGYVPKWDPKTQASTTEEEVLDIAYAPSGIVTREVKDSTFRFAKLLSSSFIGSGVVELPKDGVKKPKNSKKMHMVFYVCHGRVQVDISGVQFSAGKGSVFQVPRGNYYSFANPYQKEARLFFTQGCVPADSEEASPSQGPKTAGQESEFEADSGKSAAPATKTRGRPPKGKQKAK
ncbi:hypothetical protein N7462_002735 [Penicillium macrosclerotiorum]|uniref:uncharacterized protein n=1 Tax=Penicillium macrosclerotiorum TaxID=303699 RepID=UPI00254743C1|nr:uncharacterized protein N7462_002735 [Penicillium macrosclerotiorum]KAJ5693312.1 hypothetical protein N7462_002735 [Penicillium macrosclerotiorum]